MLLRKLLGASFFSLKWSRDKVVATFSYLGFVTFNVWYSLYFWSMYNVFIADQTILRILFETKIRQYGDLVENIVITAYVVYSMWKISYDLSGSTEHIQQIMEIDAEIEKLGEKIDYSKSATLSLFVLISHFVVCFIRVFVVCISMGNRKASLHYSKLFQITFSDSLSFTVTNYFCTYLYALRDRYKRINQVLKGLGTRSDKDLFVRNKNLINVYRMEDRNVCKKINACGKVYSMLFKASETANDKFGFALLLTMFVWLILTILYLYYFMEATAAGLFHDVQRYINFLLYVSWQIIFAVAIISSAIYFCENIVKEAKLTSYLVHTIISDTWDMSVKEEALRLSIQIVHQTPKFTARGLFIVEYELLLEGARSVLTFLVILLQFVTQKN
ncbi:unnamed protein product [Pieris macdunnoughi]|uniref:Gustatory receptor n=2 Tax=Pieris macdunnoughi TaxID=345717 RepID=A0A821N0S5_9NEOP|nr:unnamed protein product [Pieris macdunnoughi]